MKLTDLVGNEIELNGCLGCKIANKTLDVFGGIIFENDDFVITQDFELPINGFIIISTKKHFEKLNELSTNMQINLINLISKTLKILEDNKIAEQYNIILEEKTGYHFHIWLMPRHKWMIEKFGKVLKNIKEIQEYSIKNLKTQENFDNIKHTCNILKENLNKN